MSILVTDVLLDKVPSESTKLIFNISAAKKLCPTLDAPENGAVKQSGKYPGDKATYSCNQGHDLVGTDTRFCQRNGEWSEEAPVCKRKILLQHKYSNIYRANFWL